MTAQTVGGALVLAGVFWLLAAYLITRAQIRRAFAMMRHPSYSITFSDPVDDHQLHVWERLPLYDWAERGEL